MNKGVRYEWTILLDTFNNEILAHALSRNGNATPYYDCLEALKKGASVEQNGNVAYGSRSVYSSRGFQLSHEGYPILRSMSRVGTPTDKPVIDALNGWMKSELYMEFNLRSTMIFSVLLIDIVFLQ
jgi:transposase InsO family protein